MSIRGSNFENQHPFASDHALVWERCIPDGLLYGVEMSFTPTLFTLGTGFMLVAGRMFEITAAENISISPGSGYARVYVAIDTGGAATENSFDQVSFGVDYAANLDSFAELTQGEININQGAAVYQAEVAVLAINSGGVTAIERQMELVSPGAGTGAFAAIGVTYPAGSTVTVTDGKITYTAPNTNGGALFIIPYAATWIVTATDGTETATESVEITTEGQNVSVELSYWDGSLFDNGIVYVNGKPIEWWQNPNVSIYGAANTSTLVIGDTISGTAGNAAFVASLKDPIDLTDWNTLSVKLDKVGSAFLAFVHGNRDGNFQDTIGLKAYKNVNTVGTHTLDITNVNGLAYISLGVNGARYFTVSEAKLTE